MKRMILVWMLILCLMPLNVWGDSVMKDFHYDQFEEVYFRTIDNYPDPDDALFPQYPAAGRALFVVLTFDMEIQNGGLCQFFWNCGASYAKLLPDALKTVGMSDIADLYESFLSDNDITLDVIASYRERDPEYTEAYEWYRYDAFDDPYMRIWEETDFNQRIIDYANLHPEIWDMP